jgi:hypothetical protein
MVGLLFLVGLWWISPFRLNDLGRNLGQKLEFTVH